MPRAVGVQQFRNWRAIESNRTTARLALRPHAELLEIARVYCAKNGLTLTEFFEMAVINFIAVGAQQKINVGVLAPIDNKEKRLEGKKRIETPSLLSLGAHGGQNEELENAVDVFEQYTAAFNKKPYRAKPPDILFALSLITKQITAPVIEAGVIYTQVNKASAGTAERIWSSRFYENEIEKIAAMQTSEPLLEAMLASYRASWVRIFGVPALALRYDQKRELCASSRA